MKKKEIESAILADKKYLAYQKTLRYKLKLTFYYPVVRLFNRIGDIPYDIQAFWQRGSRGWANRDSWGIDNYLDSFMPELLRHMIDDKAGGGNSYPGYGAANTAAKWNAIVEKIARGFEASREMEELWYKDEKGKFDIEKHREEQKRLEAIRVEGMKLFVKWYNHLWD